MDLLDLFFNTSYLGFRCVIAPKKGLNNEAFHQTYDEWYYKMYYLLLSKMLDPTNQYAVYDGSLITCGDLGKYSEYEEQLWELFLHTYEYGSLKFRDIPIKMKHYPPTFSPKTGFYHLICENYLHQDESSRKPNFRRCERFMWAKTIIESCPDSCARLLIWENTRHNKPNVVLFCPELDYVVILAKRSQGYYLLTTAYPVDHPHRREDLLAEYHKYMQSKQRIRF